MSFDEALGDLLKVKPQTKAESPAPKPKRAQAKRVPKVAR